MRGGPRKGAGRPPEKEPKNKVLRVRLTEAELQNIARAARAEGLTLTEYVRSKLGLRGTK